MSQVQADEIISLLGGAPRIPVDDTAGNFQGDTVEEALAELATGAQTRVANYSELRSYLGGSPLLYVTAAGIAGVFVLDALDTTTADNGGTVIVTTTGKRYKRRFDGAVQVSWFGDVGDGVADDTVAIQAAVNATPYDGVLEFGLSKKHLVSQKILRTAPMSVMGNNSTILATTGLITSGGAVFEMNTKYAQHVVSPTVQTVAGSVSFTLPAGISAEVGDMLLFTSNDNFVVSGTTVYKNGMPAIVVAKSGQNVTLDTSFYGVFNVNGIGVYAGGKPKVIEGLNLDLSNFPNSTVSFTGFKFDTSSVIIRDSLFVGNDFANTAILASVGHNLRVSNCEFRHWLNSQGNGGGARSGVGVGTNANNVTIQNCKFFNCKHATTSASNKTFVVRGYVVENCEIYEDFNTGEYQGSIDCHAGNAGPVNFFKNTIYCDRSAFAIRNKAAHIIGNTVVQNPLAVSSLVVTDEQDIDGVVFEGNTVTLGTAVGAVLFGLLASSDYDEFRNLKVKNNIIKNGRIFSAGNANAKLTNIEFVGNTVDTSQNVLRFASANGVLENISITDNLFLNVGRFFEVFSSTDYSAKNIKIARNNVLSGVALLRTTAASIVPFVNLEITDNKFLATGAETIVSLKGASATAKDLTVNGLMISGNTFDNTAAAATAVYNVDVEAIVATNVEFNDNVLLRGVTNTRNSRFTACDITNLRAQGNAIDSRFGLYSAGALTSTYSDVNISGNTMSHIEFLESAASSPLILKGVEVTNNVMTYAGPGIRFQAQAGSTGWASSDEVLVEGNRITATTGNDTVVISANDVGNKVLFVGNSLSHRVNEISATYYKVPQAHSVLNGTQPWKGGTTVRLDGELYAEAAPTTGPWLAGDRVYDPTPTAGGTIGFVCTTSGTPGTWKAWGTIAA